ncbi:MAG: flagellar biosynthesis anti-sigma factor FlgM [Nitrospirae bacterium]|nr:MAG: flagellar biosynthesis anti-sigma factor FlgM [Nitrospirota bacterium]
MRIPDKIEAAPIGGLQSVARVRERGFEKTEEVQKNDQVTVSEKGKEIGRLQQEAQKIPDIRADKVDEVKDKIKAGTYNVKGEAVAGKMLKEAIIDSIV